MDKNINSQNNQKKPFEKDTLKKKIGDKAEQVGKKPGVTGDKIEHPQDK